MSSGSPRGWSAATLGNAVSIALLALLGLWLLRFQAGPWWVAPPRPERWWWAAAVLALYAAFCGLIWWRSRAAAVSAGVASAAELSAVDRDTVLVVYATQTGFALELAQRTAEALNQAGTSALVAAIDALDRQRLSQGGRMLFIVSTTGEGDPPDHALRFVQEVLGQPADLQRLRYAVLALGDRDYEQFCAFGQRLDQWLRQHQAQPLFEMIEVDDADEHALNHWQEQLGAIGGTSRISLARSRFEAWQLAERRELNPGSCGGSVFHLTLLPPVGATPTWNAGDIAEVAPRNPPQVVAAFLQTLQLDEKTNVVFEGRNEPLASALARAHLPSPSSVTGLDAQPLADTLRPLPHRDYSIASLPSDGNLQLLLRRVVRPDGTPGICSSWLCDHLPLNGEVELRIRTNPNFHLPEMSRRMILIGNGTGIAGLRGHLKARVQAGAERNWLLFGERNASRDFFFGDEIQHWQSQGAIQRLDLAFSRDQSARVYVQDKLREAAQVLHQWVCDGAAIYVCGSLVGMAPAVDGVIREVLGDEQVEQLLASGRYRRDVY